MSKYTNFFLRQIRYLLDLVSWLYGLVFWPSRRGYLPPITNSILLLPASKLAKKIKKGKLKSSDVVATYIERCKQVHPHLNAIVDDNFEDALKEAHIIDDKIQDELNGGRPFAPKTLADFPFLGVPFTAKNSIMAKGKTFSGGVYARKDIVGGRDAVAIERMKTIGGAIFLGLTNVPELVMWQDTFNRVDGRTNNPYDKARIPGGSSGGEGAIIAACGSVIGIGTDIGGSVRLPAFCCGIFGHKTTPRQIAEDGVFPEYSHIRNGVNTLGPMCRYAADIRPMLKVLAGDNLSLPKEAPLNISNLNVHYLHQLDDPMVSPVDKEIIGAINKTIKYLGERGAHIYKLDTERKFADMKNTFQIWSAAMHDPDHRLFIDFLTDGKRQEMNPYWELFKCALGLQKKYTASVMMFALSEELGLWRANIDANKEMWQRIKADFHQLLGPNGVLIAPTMPESAMKHNESLSKFSSFQFTSLFSALNVAVTNVPMGLDRKGMPIGIQIIATAKNDNLSIQVAEALEDHFGGWVPPCEIKL